MGYKILVIDDEEYIHVIARKLLGDEFEVLKANRAQEAIDILSEQSVHLILSDIHMPGLSGLEFLESLGSDAEKAQIPVLIMTYLSTKEKEERAYRLGAADYIDKEELVSKKDEVLELVRMKLVSNVVLKDVDKNLVDKKNKIVSAIMKAAIDRSFKDSAEMMVDKIGEEFSADHVSLWSVIDNSSELLSSHGDYDTHLSADRLTKQSGFTYLGDTREPYLTNNVMGLMKYSML